MWVQQTFWWNHRNNGSTAKLAITKCFQSSIALNERRRQKKKEERNVNTNSLCMNRKVVQKRFVWVSATKRASAKPNERQCIRWANNTHAVAEVYKTENSYWKFAYAKNALLWPKKGNWTRSSISTQWTMHLCSLLHLTCRPSSFASEIWDIWSNLAPMWGYESYYEQRKQYQTYPMLVSDCYE